MVAIIAQEGSKRMPFPPAPPGLSLPESRKRAGRACKKCG